MAWQMRRDTAANWESENPVLAEGEPGWDTTNDVLKVGDGTTAWNDLDPYGDSDGGSPELFHVQDEKSQGTGPGNISSGDWRTRDLNTVKTNEISGASLSSNQISLPAGDYEAQIFAPAYRVDMHRARLRDVTNSVTLVEGQSTHAANSQVAYSNSMGWDRFTLSDTATVELQHRVFNTERGGHPASFGIEVYSIVRIWKI